MTNQSNLRGILQNNTPPARTKILSQEQFEIDFAEYLENLERNPQPSPSETTPTNSNPTPLQPQELQEGYIFLPELNIQVSKKDITLTKAGKNLMNS